MRLFVACRCTKEKVSIESEKEEGDIILSHSAIHGLLILSV